MKVFDWLTAYALGWLMIALAPAWLPVYLAVKITRWGHESAS